MSDFRKLGLWVLGLVTLLAACEEEATDPTFVKGTLGCSMCNKVFNVSGTLAKGGEQYWGYCTKTDKSFDFVVGTTQPGNDSKQSDFSFAIYGISGTPVNGALDAEGKVKKDVEERAFGSVRIHNVNAWSFGWDEVNSEECHVQLFAEAATLEDGSTELIPGTEQEFDYYVDFNCTGLSVVDPASEQLLESVSMQLFFNGC